LHDRENRLHPHQGRDNVELENGAQVDRIQLLEGNVEALSGVVHQHIDRAEGVDGLGDQQLDLSRDGDIGWNGQRAWELDGEGLEAFGSPSSEHDPGSLAVQ
jgi:hypothetical protein